MLPPHVRQQLALALLCVGAVSLAALDDDDDEAVALAGSSMLTVIAGQRSSLARHLLPLLLALTRLPRSRRGLTYGVRPAADLFTALVGNSVLFQALTNFSPGQFATLMQLLLDPNHPEAYLLKPRDPFGRRPLNRQQAAPGGRPHKLTPETRLFLCLARLKDDDRLARIVAWSGKTMGCCEKPAIRMR
jgi:hypothetical protein